MINKKELERISPNREILIQEENFIYLLPCKQLRTLISNFTITFPHKSIISDNYTIMPHGSVTLVLFNYNDKIYNFLFGPTTKPIKVGDLANKCSIIFIIEFQPAGLFPFTKINQKELTDKIIPFSSIDDTFDKTIQNIFKNALSVDEMLFDFEEKLILNIQSPYPNELALAIKIIIEKAGIMTTIEIVNNSFYSSRHLNRLFNQYLGMGIKAFSRLVRINNSLHLLKEKSYSLNIISEQLGYYDESHFIKDFKLVCGITPLEYKTNLSDFYNEIAKF